VSCHEFGLDEEALRPSYHSIRQNQTLSAFLKTSAQRPLFSSEAIAEPFHRSIWSPNLRNDDVLKCRYAEDLQMKTIPVNPYDTKSPILDTREIAD